jgi:hypothetical protein
MELTLSAVLGVPGPQDLTWVDDALAALDPDKASVGAVVSSAPDGGRGHVALLWAGADDARRALAPADLPGGVRVEVANAYTVEETCRPVAPGMPRYVQITEFTGPRSAEWLASFRRGSRERVWPAVRDVPGGTASFVAVAAGGAAVTLSLAESPEALQEAVRRIMSTELLPGERPELLTGPDRSTTEPVAHAIVPEGPWSLR